MLYNESYFLNEDKEVKEKFLKAIHKVGKIVASTMGAKGENALILTDLGVPRVTNDGITVINSLNFEDPIEQLATELLRQVSAKTNWECGDFSSGSAVFTSELIKSGIKLDRDTDEIIEKVVDYIKSNSKEAKTVQDLINVATVSSKDVELGKLIGELSWKINENSSVLIKPSTTGRHYQEAEDGLSIRGNFVSREFYEGPKQTVIEPKIMLVNDEIVAFSQIKPIFTMIAHAMDQKKYDRLNDDYIIFAKNYSQEVIESVALANKKYNTSIKLGVLQVPARIAQDTFENLSLLTGSIIMGGKTSFPLLKETKSPFYDINNYGTVKELKIHTVPAREFIFLPFQELRTSKETKMKIDILKKEIKDVNTPEDEVELKKMLLNQLDGQIANLYIAADGNVETQHLMLKAEDAVNACKSAKELGIVPGGSVVFKDAARTIERLNPELAKVIESLFYHILANANIQPKEFYDTNTGVNVKTGEIGDMIEMNIVDPAKGLIHGLKNAYSLAKQINESSTIIIKTKNTM